jgi:hypothetical protein
MIRRSPTRTELRLENIEEWDLKRREVEAARKPTTPTSAAQHKKDAAQERNERIGYVPQPRIS